RLRGAGGHSDWPAPAPLLRFAAYDDSPFPREVVSGRERTGGYAHEPHACWELASRSGRILRGRSAPGAHTAELWRSGPVRCTIPVMADARLDTDSAAWLGNLRDESPARTAAVDRLHAMLLRVTRAEAGRRRASLPERAWEEVEELCREAG